MYYVLSWKYVVNDFFIISSKLVLVLVANQKEIKALGSPSFSPPEYSTTTTVSWKK